MNDYFSCDGHPSRTVLTIKSCKFLKSALHIKTFIQQELLKNNILWTGYHCITYTFNEKDIQLALNAYKKTFTKINFILDNKKNIKKYIVGKLLKPVFTRVSDFQAASLKAMTK